MKRRERLIGGGDDGGGVEERGSLRDVKQISSFAAIVVFFWERRLLDYGDSARSQSMNNLRSTRFFFI